MSHEKLHMVESNSEFSLAHTYANVDANLVNTMDNLRASETPTSEVVSGLFNLIMRDKARLEDLRYHESNESIADQIRILNTDIKLRTQKILNALREGNNNDGTTLSYERFVALEGFLDTNFTQENFKRMSTADGVFKVFKNPDASMQDAQKEAYENKFVEKVVAQIEQDHPDLSRLVFFMGGAAEFADNSDFQMFFDQLVQKLSSPPGEVFFGHGGTNAGIMKLVGEAVGKVLLENPELKLVNMGIFPADSVRGFDDPTTKNDKFTLAPNMSYALPIQGTPDQIPEWGGWGCETKMMYKVFNALAAKNERKSVGIMANGGKITLDELKANLAVGRKVLVVKGTGRGADLVAWLKEDSSRLSLSNEDFDRNVPDFSKKKKELLTMFQQVKDMLNELAKEGSTTQEKLLSLLEVVSLGTLVEMVSAIANPSDTVQSEVVTELRPSVPVPENLQTA